MDQEYTLEELKLSLEAAKEQLKSTDENIKKLTGRDPVAMAMDRRRPLDGRLGGPPSKRPAGPLPLHSKIEETIPSPLREDPRLDRGRRFPTVTSEPDFKAPVASSVIRVTQTRSRQDAINEMKKSETTDDKARGRRMLGVLLGTLVQFKSESMAATREPQAKRRRKVDERIEERDQEEKEAVRRARAELYRSRREQEMEVRRIQQKMRVAEAFQRWKLETLKMKGYIRTERKPHIFYRPKVANEESQRRLDASSQAIDDMIERRRIHLTDHLNTVRRQDEAKRREKQEIAKTTSISSVPRPSSAVAAVNAAGKEHGQEFEEEDDDDEMKSLSSEPSEILADADEMAEIGDPDLPTASVEVPHSETELSVAVETEEGEGGDTRSVHVLHEAPLSADLPVAMETIRSVDEEQKTTTTRDMGGNVDNDDGIVAVTMVNVE